MMDKMEARRFVYAGKRLTRKQTLAHTWLPEGASAERDEVRLFDKAKGSVIGGIYTIEADDSHYISGSVRYMGEQADEATTLLFESRDRADGVLHTQRTMEKNHARTSQIKELCAPLREMVGKQVGWANRAALLAYITSEISRG